MTIDVEDYFHVSAFDGVVPRSRWETLESRVCANTERVLAILDGAGVRGDVLRARVGRRAASGARAADCRVTGTSSRRTDTPTGSSTTSPPSAFRQDVAAGEARCIEDVAGACAWTASGRRATRSRPRSLWALDVLIDEGYRYDASIFPIQHDRYGIPVSARHDYQIERPTGSMLEVPASATRLLGMNLPVGGGGYFRILPYDVDAMGPRADQPDDRRAAMFYIHPWEVDPEQPRLSAGLLSRFRHYRNLHLTEARLRRLLGDFAFAPIMQALLREPESAVPADVLTAALPYHW